MEGRAGKRWGGWLVVALMMCGWLGMTAWAADDNKIIDDAMGKMTVVEIQGITSIAIVAFEYGPGVEVKNVEEKVVKVLSRKGRFKVVDRRALDLLLKEQAISMSGITEEGNIKKIGKAINVDAFLFGKVTRAAETIVINLELRDVATTGILWSEEMVGENPDKASMGLGMRVGMFEMSSQTFVLSSTTAENAQVNSQGSYIAFMGHFVQRFGWTKAFSFGADAIFSRGDWATSRFNGSVAGGTYNLLQTSTYRDWNLTLIPLLRFHPAYLLGVKTDILVIYGGAGFSGDYFQLEGTFNLTNKTNAADTTGDIAYNRTDLYPGNIAWKVGAEMRLTEQLSMFFEAYHLPGVTAKYQDVDTRIAPEVSVKSSLYYGFGAKYYFFSF